MGFTGQGEEEGDGHLLGSDRLGPRKILDRFMNEAKNQNSQVPWEVDVKAPHDGQVIAEELERDNVQDTLETVDGGRDDDGLVSGSAEHEAWDSLGISLEGWVILRADDDGSTFPSGDLSESRLDFFEMRIAGHDDDDWHVLVDQGKRTVLEFTGKNT